MKAAMQEVTSHVRGQFAPAKAAITAKGAPGHNAASASQTAVRRGRDCLTIQPFCFSR